MRPVTKESLTITKIKKMELLTLAAYVTLVEILLRPCEEKKKTVKMPSLRSMKIFQSSFCVNSTLATDSAGQWNRL